MYGSGNLPGPLQDKHSYQMLVAKLRHKAERDSQQDDLQQQQQQHAPLKDSKLSQYTTKTVDHEAQHPQLIESTGGGYVSATQHQTAASTQQIQL